MIYKSMKFYSVLLMLFFSAGAFAQQQQMSPEEREKKLYESIQERVNRYAEDLDLEDWQVFYVDSILTHDCNAMQKEFDNLSSGGARNIDLYADIQDKWNENIYNAFRKVFNDDQWGKYLKQGGSRDKKARDKRAAKKQK